MPPALLPQTLSNLAKFRIRISTSSHCLGCKLESLSLDGGFNISLQRYEDAVRICSLCSVFEDTPREVVEALRSLFW